MNSGSAAISDCGLYRYRLTRDWNGPARSALFIMLNPSTADADKDDATIRRCTFFARREGCGRLVVVNLFSLRATDPKELRTHEDPEGPSCDGFLYEEVQSHRGHGGLIIAAWGADPFARRRAEYVSNHIGPVQCLGLTKAGAPKHPLYFPNNAPVVPYAGKSLRRSS